MFGGRLGLTEILLIIILVLILFSHNKIPTMMRNLANGLKTFKNELKSDEDKDNAPAAKKKPASKKVTYVEFGAYASMSGANTAQRRLIGANPELFADYEFVILEDGAKPAFKLRIAFNSVTAARSFVRSASAAGVKCDVVA